VEAFYVGLLVVFAMVVTCFAGYVAYQLARGRV
jgi:hypothetical protein